MLALSSCNFEICIFRTLSYTVLTRRFGGDYLAEGSANCAAINLIFNYFRQHVISGSTASESDSDLSDAEVDDELHSNGMLQKMRRRMQPWLPLLRRQQVLFGLFSLNRSMINSYANITSFPPIINRHKFYDSETSANYKSPVS